MKNFVLHLLYAIIPLVFFAIGYECFVRTIPNMYTFKDEWLRNKENRVETLVLGSSVTLTGVDVSQMKNAFNLAFSMNPIHYDLFLLEKYYPYHKELRTIVMPLDYGNLFLNEEKMKKYDPYLIPYMGIYMGYPVKSFDIRDHLEITAPISCQSKVREWLSAKKNHRPISLLCDSLGFQAYQIENRKADWTQGYVIDEAYDEKVAMQEKVKLFQLAKFCKEKNLRLVLISSPYWYEYAENLLPEKLRLVEQTAKECVDIYGAEYKCYTFDERFIYYDSLFYNFNHLTREGASAFTKVLINDFGL